MNFPKSVSQNDQRRNSRLFLIIFLAALSAFGPFVTDFYLPALPMQQTDFSTSAAMVQLGLSATMWGLAAGQLWVGPFSDRHGRRLPLAGSLLVFSLATLGAVFAPTIEVFIGMRFLEGLGASGALVMSRSVAADLYTGRELGSFMAVVGAVQGIAPVTAPMFGALIADFAGWREIFWLLFAIGAVLLVLTVVRFCESLPPERRRRAGEGSAASFVFLMKDTLFVAVVLQQLASSFVLFGHISASPFIFQTHFGLSATAYGLLFGGMATGVTVGAISSSRMPSPAAALEAGAWGMLAGAVLTAGAFWADLPLWATVPAFLVLLLSLGLTLPAAMTFALTLHRERAGAAAAVLGAVAFVSGGAAAPLTSVADPRLCVSVIFIASAVILVAIALWMRPMVRILVKRKPAGEPVRLSESEADED